MGAGKGRGSLFILTGISLIPSFIEYIVTVLSGAFPSLLGIVWRVSAAFLGDAVLNGTVRGMLWRACPSSKGKNHPSSPIVSRRAPSSLPRILRAAPGWSSAISANSLGWTSPIGRKEPSPPYWRSNAPADGVDRGSDQFGTQGISASRENPFAQRMVRVGLAQESAADILGQIDRF